MLFSSHDRSFWPSFQKRWAEVLCEQTEGLRNWSEAMARALGCGIIEVPNSFEAYAALGVFNARLARVESLCCTGGNAPLDDFSRALFLRYGAAFLGLPTPTIQGHNFVASDSFVRECADKNAGNCNLNSNSPLDYAALGAMLHHVCACLQLLKLVPRRVLAFDNFDSQIIGRWLAQHLEVDFAIVSGDGFNRSKSLVVSADSRALAAPQLRTVFPGQVLYSFNLSEENGTVAPDMSSLARPFLSLPWHGQSLSSCRISGLVERITQETVPSLTPTREAEALRQAQHAHLEFYRARRSLLTAGNSTLTRKLQEFA